MYVYYFDIIGCFSFKVASPTIHQEMVTFIEPVAKSQSSNKDDCSLKMILIFKFGPVFFWLCTVLMYFIEIGQIAVTEILVL